MTRTVGPAGGDDPTGVENPADADVDADGQAITNAGDIDAREGEFRTSELVDSFQDGMVPKTALIPLREAGRLSPPEAANPSGIFVVGGYAYVTGAGSDTLAIFDVSSPGSPAQVASLSTGDLAGADGVFVKGDFAYVAADTAGSLTIVDVSDPTSPSQSGALSTTELNGASDVSVKGSHAYVAVGGNNNFVSVDVSDPTSPLQEDVISFAEVVGAVFVRGDYAYVGWGSLNFFSPDPGNLTTVDISNPASMSRVDTTTDVDIENPTDVFVRGGTAYLSSLSEFASIDVSDPASLSITDTLNLNQSTNLTVRGNYAYVTESNNDTLTAVDISNPSSLSQVGTVSITSCQSIFAHGDHVYVGAGGSEDALVAIGADGVVDTGTVTASGGTSPDPAVDTTLTNADLEQTQPHDLDVYVDADPSFDADYAFNYDWGFQWDDANSEVDINLVVNWDTDPGGGNDVTLRWELVPP